MFKLNAKFSADSLLYLFRHFERNGHTVHMLTQQNLLLPPTSRVKLLLFMHAHSSPLPITKLTDVSQTTLVTLTMAGLVRQTIYISEYITPEVSSPDGGIGRSLCFLTTKIRTGTD